MTVVHIVLFEFLETASAATINDTCQRMLDLKNQCVDPSSGRKYIRDSVGGKDCSIERKQDGLTHAFVVYFDSIADRDYYVRDDPAHRAFVETLEGVTKKPREAVVMDFEPGKF